jgi:hypothetical protein
MSKKIQSFQLDKLEHLTKFTNNTDYMCWINAKPIPPKRKLQKICRVGPGEWKLFEWDAHTTWNLSSIAITFESVLE